jgi:Suppressor of fused protein (SUFU)
MGLIEHLEGYLGEIEGGWSRDADGDDMPFEVARFPRGSGRGTISFATLGLSRYPLQSWSGKEIRHELLMIVPDSLREGPVPGLLQQIGMEALGSARPVLRGEVIGPRGELITGSPMEALYAAIPVHFPDDFAVYEGDDESVAVVWLVPISAREASYVKRHGWRAFEDLLAELDPDLTDLSRPSMRVDSS